MPPSKKIRIKDPCEKLVKEVKALREEIAEIKKLLSAKRAPALEKEVQVPRVNNVYTPNGVRVGDKAYCIYDGEVFFVVVKSIRCRERVLDVERVDVVEEWEASFEDVFPYTEEGKKAAEEQAGEYSNELFKKEVFRARIFVHAMEGDLTIKALENLGNRAVTSMASMVGLSPFRDLKGLTGNERIKCVAKAARKYREKRGTASDLKKAKKVILQFEKMEFEKENQLRGKSKVIQLHRNNTFGRTLATDNSFPARPAVGDLLFTDKTWWRIDLVNKNNVVAKSEKNGIKRSFKEVEFWQLDAKRTPVWTAVS